MNLNDMDQTYKLKILVTLASIVYLLVASLLVGLRVEHWVLIGLYNGCFYLNPKTRRFILAFTIFMVFGILYDLMKSYPNYMVNAVDISGIYHFEKSFFGIPYEGNVLTPNEFFQKFHHSVADILAGLFYINWMPVPLAFAFFLYVKKREQFLHFSLTFFFVNLLGFCIYYIHPAAPPWYVSLYGFDLHLEVHGNTAGLARFDELLNIHIFESIYSRNSNVFAALPSLHSAYPVVVFYYALKNKLGWINWLLGLFMAGIWFSAIYSGHHYLTDVLSGIICAVVGIWIFQKGLLSLRVFKNWINQYLILIS